MLKHLVSVGLWSLLLASGAQRAVSEGLGTDMCGYVCVYPETLPIFSGVGSSSSARQNAPAESRHQRAERDARLEDAASAEPTAAAMWREHPHLMDSSWKRWPSLTDF